MTIRTVAAVLLGFFAAMVHAQAPTREELANNPPLFLDVARKALQWDEPAEPAHIVGPIYSVGTKGLSVFLIKTSDGYYMTRMADVGNEKVFKFEISR